MMRQAILETVRVSSVEELSPGWSSSASKAKRWLESSPETKRWLEPLPESLPQPLALMAQSSWIVPNVDSPASSLEARVPRGHAGGSETDYDGHTNAA